MSSEQKTLSLIYDEDSNTGSVEWADWLDELSPLTKADVRLHLRS